MHSECNLVRVCGFSAIVAHLRTGDNCMSNEICDKSRAFDTILYAAAQA